jgi:hypothetical protein
MVARFESIVAADVGAHHPGGRVGRRISPGAVTAELPNTETDPQVAERIRKFYAQAAIPAEWFGAIAFATS